MRKTDNNTKGYIHIYTGTGKGKTTAALGLALRAAGAGKRVFIGQFLKSGEYSEVRALSRMNDLITIKQFGSGKFIEGKPEESDRLLVRKGLEIIRDALLSEEYDVIIMDEANLAIYYDLIQVDELISVIDQKPDHVEIIITGRFAAEKLMERADLVTEMREIKHYMKRGVRARVGIEL